MLHNTRTTLIVLAILVSVCLDTMRAQPPSRTQLDKLDITRELMRDLQRGAQYQRDGNLPAAKRIYTEVIRKTEDKKSPARFEALMNLDKLRPKTRRPGATQRRPDPETYRAMLKSKEVRHRSWANSVLGQQHRNSKEKDYLQIARDFGDVPQQNLSQTNQHLLAQAYKNTGKPDKALDLYLDLAKESRDGNAVDQSFVLLGDRSKVRVEDADNALGLANRLIKTQEKWMVGPGVSKVLANNSWDEAAKGKADELLSVLLKSVERATPNAENTADFTPNRLRRDALSELEKNSAVKLQVAEIKEALNGSFDLDIDRQAASQELRKESEKWGGPAQYKVYLSFLNKVGEQFLVGTPDQPMNSSKAAGAFYAAWIHDATDTGSALRLADVIKKYDDGDKDMEKVRAAFRRDLGDLVEKYDEKQGLQLALAHLRLGDWFVRRDKWDDAIDHYKRAVDLESTGFRQLPSAHERLAFALAKANMIEEAAAESANAGRAYSSVGDNGRVEVARLMRESIGFDQDRDGYEKAVREKLLGAMRIREGIGRVTGHRLIFGPDGMLLVDDWTSGSIYVVDMGTGVERGPVVPRDLDVPLDAALRTAVGGRPSRIYSAAFDKRRRLLYLSGQVKTRPFLARVRLGAEVTAKEMPIAELPHVRFLMPTVGAQGRRSGAHVLTYVPGGHLIVLRRDDVRGLGINLYTELILFNLLTGDRQPPLRVESFHPSRRGLGRYPPRSIANVRINGKSYLLTAFAGAPITLMPMLDACSPFPRVKATTIAQIPSATPGNMLFTSQPNQAWIADPSNRKLWPLRLDGMEFPPIEGPVDGPQGPLGEPVAFDGRFRAFADLGDNLSLVVTQGDDDSLRARAISLP